MGKTRPDRRGTGPDGDHYDTVGRDLLRHGLTLRHRAGEWTLSVPNAHGRMDFRIRGDSVPPAGMARLVGGVTFGRPLVRVSAGEVGARRPPASASVLARYLEAQVQAIACGDVWLRAGLDAVHSTRVGIRRCRSVLRVFGPLLGGDLAWLDNELQWYARLLGKVRDPQVQRRRFAAALAELPEEVASRTVADLIDGELRREETRRWADVRAALDGDRYRALLAALSTGFPDGPCDDDEVIRLARRAGRRAGRRLAEANEAGGAEDASRAERLHRARKSAKRARYAYELAAPALGRKAKGRRLARERISHFATVQRVLGEHQDSVLAAGTLRRLGVRAGLAAGENGVTFGELYGLELQRAWQARAEAARLAAGGRRRPS